MTVPAVAAVAGSPQATLADWRRMIADLSVRLGWSTVGSPAFSSLVSRDDRVLVKPNWVMHVNRGPWGLGPLVTDPACVMAVCELLLECGPRAVTLGDAPLQSCDVAALWSAPGLLAWADALRANGRPLVGPVDFRRTVARFEGTALVQATDQRDASHYTLVNLGRDSLLEPLSHDSRRFRVTQYDPRLMWARHRPGHHEYLIAREALDATLVVNLPKLKTHKKAGVTCALKNLVGINGNKEFLPHHRVGAPGEGGDCYRVPHPFKRAQEWLLDLQNQVGSVTAKRALQFPFRVASALARPAREPYGLEGAWSGNDTVWRMCLDLNRALRYADRDGLMHDAPQRREVQIVDAIVAGQGDGPLAPEPLSLGLVLGGDNAAAVDAVGTWLLGYRLDAIPITRHAADDFRYRLADTDPRDIVRAFVTAAQASGPPLPHRYPDGWLDAVDRARRTTPAEGTTFIGRPAA